MIQNIGFKFNKGKWFAALMFAATANVASADTSSQKHHYELLDLDQLQTHITDAEQHGDMQAVATLSLAASAIEETLNGQRATPNDLPSDFSENLYEEHQHELYHVINPAEDVDWTKFALAEKIADVHAEWVPEGTPVDTIMKDGHVETTNIAKEGGGYRVTNPDGEQYLASVAEMAERYTDNGDGTFSPKAVPRKVLEVEENVSFTASWNETMYIKDGGYLVNNGPKDIYGIEEKAFNNTHRLLGQQPA